MSRGTVKLVVADDKEFQVPISFIYPEVVKACHNEVRKKFEPYLNATSSLLEVHVLSGLTLRLVRLALATKILVEAGFKEEAKLQFRSAVECIVNLLYIMDVGPKTGDKSTNELAKQFGAYGDLAYAKLLRQRPAQAKKAFVRRKIYTEAEFDAFYAEKQRLGLEAESIYGCRSSSWHPKSLSARAELVKTHAPSYVDGSFADMMFSSFQSPNSAVHGDALSLRSQYKDLGGNALEIRYSVDSGDSDATGQMVLWAWKTMAVYYGKKEEEWLNKLLDKTMRSEMTKRLDLAEEMANRKILLPWEQ
jgi:hypothetical protein